MDTEYRSAVQRYQLALLQAKQLYQGYRAALAHVITLRKGVEDCSIRAPFDGWVAERDVVGGRAGDLAVPQRQTGDHAADRSLAALAHRAAAGVARIKTGQTVTFQTDAFPGKTFSGTVRYITPQVASENRSLCVEALVPNPGAVLRPGLFVTAELQLDAGRPNLRAGRGRLQPRRRGRRVRGPRRGDPRADRLRRRGLRRPRPRHPGLSAG